MCNSKFDLIRSFVGLVAFTILMLSGFLAIIIHIYGRTDRQQSADAIVILAGQNYRIEHAASLWREGVAPQIVCTGGLVKRGVLAEECRQYLLDLGIPDEVILLEDQSLSTEEHALYLQPILAEQGWQSIVIVSSDYHLFRSVMLFRAYGITAYPSPAPDPDFRAHEYFLRLFREVAAVEWYVIKTVLRLDYTRVDGF